MVVPSENQLGSTAGKSEKPSVMATSIDDGVLCWSDCLREWSGDEEALSLDYAVQTPSHFTMILYLKFMCTDSNDRVYP